jgi:hypothetical protein
MLLGLLSVILLVLFSCGLVGVWIYTRTAAEARRRELDEIRQQKDAVKRRQKLDDSSTSDGRKAHQSPSPLAYADAVHTDLQRRHPSRPNVDIRGAGLEASPLLGNASPTRADQEEEAALLR